MKFLKSYLKSLSVFLLAGFSVLGVYAALSTVSSGDPLTATSWNEMVSKLTSLNTNNDDLVTKSYVDSQVSANSSGVEFVGYTTTYYNGGMGGPGGPTKNCRNEYPGSRICSSEDLIASGVDNPSVRARMMDYTVYQSYTCNDWRVGTNGATGVIFNTNGDITTTHCNNSYPIACCRG